MNDMSGVIVPKSDQYNADDFLAGPRTFTIRGVTISGGQEQPVNMSLEGTDKFFRPCKSMCRVLVHAWGRDASAYVGRSLTLYCDPEVKWGGLAVGGIRISHMTDITGRLQLMLTATKGQRKPHTVMPLVISTKKTVADYKAEIDACADLEALAEWQTANELIGKSDKATAVDIWSYGKARGAALTEPATGGDESRADDATITDF